MRTQWEQWGTAKPWLTRSGVSKTLHGQAFYPRTVIPPEYIDKPFPELPDPIAETPPCNDSKVTYFTVPKITLAYLWFTDNYDPGELSGISIFQVNPKAIGHTWFYKHTHLVATRSPIVAVINTWVGVVCTLHWPYTSADKLVMFWRVWYKNAFLNFGPTVAEDSP